jgi:hypothetical protein
MSDGKSFSLKALLSTKTFAASLAAPFEALLAKLDVTIGSASQPRRRPFPTPWTHRDDLRPAEGITQFGACLRKDGDRIRGFLERHQVFDSGGRQPDIK